MLVRFADKLRVVVGSGNAAFGDWMFWSNCFVKLDCPALSALQPKSLLDGQEQYFQRALGVHPSAKGISSLEKEEAKTEPAHLDEFALSVARYWDALNEFGYSFGQYLRRFLRGILEDKHRQLREFLDIDLDDFDLAQPGVFLVGSIPGAFANGLHYSSSDILDQGISALYPTNLYFSNHKSHLEF